MARVLVVGAGLAGARICQELRRTGFTGWIGLLGAEREAPYDRPPLTKEPHAEVDLRVAMGLDVWALADVVRLGCTAHALTEDGGSLRVRFSSASDLGAPGSTGAEEELVADAVVVATGALPIVPSGWRQPGVHVLHTRPDADRLWSSVHPGAWLGVVGGGWIGCEAAATAAARGARVTLFEAADRLLADRLPEQVGARVRQWLVEAGVAVHLGTPVEDVRSGDGGLDLRAGGTVHPVDEVLVGLGVRPATGWLDGSGIARDATGAVLADPWGRTNRPGVFAVGDAAARWSARSGRHLPGGHWNEALTGPEVVAPVLAEWTLRSPDQRLPEAWSAPPTEAIPDPVPYVFSHVGERILQVMGDVAPGGEVLIRPDGPAWTAWVLDEQARLRGVCALGRPRDVAAARRAIRSDPAGRPPAADLLAKAQAG